MKIDRSKLKKNGSEVPKECKVLIEKIKACSKDELLLELKQIKTWTYGKCELYHWIDVLDVFDEILDKSCKKEKESQWLLPCDTAEGEQMLDLLLQVLSFTSLLIEHSFTRHLYNSVEHLTTLLSSSNMSVVLGVLNLLYVFSKRSNFITRLTAEKKQELTTRLTHLAESWGGKDNGFGLAECCQDLPITDFPSSATTLHFEYYADIKDEKSTKKSASVLSSLHIERVDQRKESVGKLMENLMQANSVPESKQMLLFTHIRLAHAFSSYEKRMQCVQARLQAISILVYANAMTDNVNSLLYSGFIEELVDILEIKDTKLTEIKATALRTLTSIIHLDRNPKLANIVDATGAASYHGFLPSLVRSCIQHMTDTTMDPVLQPFATALFSFLYHLASYESGGEALVSCGMMESLLKVINWYGDGQEHITFVTRAVRVVDLITNLDMQAFQSHTGLNAFISRLEHEVNICRKEQPFVIRPKRSESVMSMEGNPDSPVSLPEKSGDPGGGQTPKDAAMETEAPTTSQGETEPSEGASTSAEVKVFPEVDAVKGPDGKGPQCFPQRGALLKSMLNFLKKAIPDPAFSDSIRHLMEGTLPRSLKHIISNAEYYGASLFLLATDVVTVYVFQEPSLLSSLQDNGLTDVVLQALLVKDVPATREVLASLPNVFSALCLNNRGLEAFVECKPFNRLFKVLLSPDYLPAMRRRRSSDPPGDTASSLGSAMDELMRNQPSLRTEATKAIIKLLEEVCAMGRDAQYICQKPQPKVDTTSSMSSRSNITADTASSDDDDDDDEVASTHSGSVAKQQGEGQASQEGTSQNTPERTAIPLMDYVLNVMKFVEAILSNNTTDDHCREFVSQKGLAPLMGILGLPNLPIDFPQSPSCQAVAAVCKSILTLSHEPQVLKQGLLHLNDVLQELEPIHRFVEPPGGSVLLRELANVQNVADPTLSAQATPLLHTLASAHAYITMFTHVCKVGQADIRSISINHWGSDLGLQVLKGLARLYTSLVWESTMLLAFCSEDVWPEGCDFGKSDLEKLLKNVKDKDGSDEPSNPSSLGSDSNSTDTQSQNTPSLQRTTGDMASNGVSAAMESLSTSENVTSPMEVEEVGNVREIASRSTSGTSTASESKGFSSETDEKASTSTADKKNKLSPSLQAQIKQIKPLLSATSRLGRALAELFGLLVKLCVGSPVRQRRLTQVTPAPVTPTPAARAVAKTLGDLLAQGFSWSPPDYIPVPKLKLTFYICSVGFTAPMLFDDKKYPYHLMLQKFLSCSGQENLFQSFEWALSSNGKVPLEQGLEHPDLPDGTGEFLDSWLMLVEKMVNVKNILETTHTMPNKSSQSGFVPFDPLKYLVLTHKMAFNAVMHLWNKVPLKVYGGHMSESILAILCHIIKGEATIKEKLEKERPKTTPGTSTPVNSANSTTSTSGGPGATTPVSGVVPAPVVPADPAPPDEPEVNQEHLQQLMDMGFPREHCRYSLLNTSSLEQATEYILTHPPAPPSTLSQGVDLELSEMDQMMRAIAMSLGENILVSSDEQKAKEEEKKKKEDDVDKDKQAEIEPLGKDVLDAFTETMTSGCMQLIDHLPGAVYRVCELVVVIANRNGESWRDEFLTGLLAEIAELCLHLMDAAAPMTSSDTRTVAEWAGQLTSMEQSAKLAVRLHLLSLLFEELKMPCAVSVEESGVLDLLVRLLDTSQQCLTASKEAPTPKWIAPVLLLLDQYERMSVSSKRMADLDKLVGKTHVWKWFDDRTGRWSTYASSNNKTIDDSFMAGDTVIRFTAGRRRYTVHFNTMVQINEETGNRRPIMLSLPAKDEPKDQDKKDKGKSSSKVGQGLDLEFLLSADGPKPKESATEAEEDKIEEKPEETPAEPEKVLKGLMPDQIGAIIRSTVGLISLPVAPDTLHAVMRLTLRLTRENQFALMFAELGGPKLLLSLTQASFFQGVVSLSTLILRHILEDCNSLKYTMEKVIRTASAGTGSSMSGVARGSMGSKEFNYVMRVLGPAVCRAPGVFTQVGKNILRITLPPSAKRDEDDARLTNPSTPQLLECVPSKQLSIPAVPAGVRDVISELLNVLANKHSYKDEAVTVANSDEQVDNRSLTEAVQDVVNTVMGEINQRQPGPGQETNPVFQRIQEASESLPPSEENSQGPSSNNLETENSSKKEELTAEEKEAKEAKAKEETKKKQPLFSKSVVMRLLAELVRSYAGCAMLITQHQYHAGQTELVSEDCSMLGFVLDHLLPQVQDAGDKDCPALSRVLVASLAACNHSPEAQTSLATEIKAALQRALAMPESAEKHTRIQAMTGIISTVIEACPVPGHVQNQMFRGQQQTGNMNNMVKIMLKKGLVTDLARITHSLDLSSPNMANTVNAALKPLETLSRIVNQPQTVNTKQGGKKGAGNLAVSGTSVITAGVTSGNHSQQGGNENSAPPEVQGNAIVIAQAPPTQAGEALHIEDVTDSHSQDEGLEETEPSSTVEPVSAMTLQEMARRDSDNAEEQVLGEIIMDTAEHARHGSDHDDVVEVINVEVETEEMDHHDSAMMTQDISDTTDEEDHADQDDHDHEEENASEGEDDHDEDDEDEDEDEDDEDDAAEDDEDDGSDSEMDGDDDEFHDVDDDFYRLNEDDDFFVHLEEMLPPGHVRACQLPIAVHDTEHGNEFTGPSVPPAPSNVSAAHPLLVRHPEPHAMSGSMAARIHRAGRPQRGTYRYNPNTQTLHVHYNSTGNRPPNPPAILQRLLGSSAASDVLQLTNNLTSASQGRFNLIHSDELRFFSRGGDDDQFEELFQDPLFDNDGSNSGVLSSVPSALQRWTEEARVLDGDSMHAAITVLKPEINQELERHRDKMLAERREQRKKTAEEEAARKEKEREKRQESSEAKAMDQGESSATVDSIEGTAADDEDEANKTIEWQVWRENAASSTSSESQPGSSASNASAPLAVSTTPVQETASTEITPAGGSPSIAEMAVADTAEIQTNSVQTPADGSTTGPGNVPESAPPTSEIPPPMEAPPPPVQDLSSSSSLTYPAAQSNSPDVRAPLQAVDMVPQTPAVSDPVGSRVEAPAPLDTPMIPAGAMQLSMETPAQPLPMVTPSAPMGSRFMRSHPESPLDMPTPMVSSTASHVPSDPNSERLLSDLARINEVAEMLEYPASGQEKAQQSVQGTSTTGNQLPEANPSATGEPSTSAPTGRITPEQPSDITSSDAVTINSSSGNSSETPSVAEAAEAPSGPDVPTTATESAVTTSGSMEFRTPPRSNYRRGEQNNNMFGDMELPDGVDPSFLAALPDNIRQEVIAEQLRLQRIQQRAQQQQQQAESLGVTEVNPEFLAALPPNIQEEVLAQQRAEQARLSTNTTQPDPESNLDPSSFIQSLPPTLRQQVLADMDDSMVAVLPADLAAEANVLRRDFEERNRRLLVQDRLSGAGLLSGILRHPGLYGRLGTTRYAIRTPPSRSSHWAWPYRNQTQSTSNPNTVKLRGRHLLDQEALTCLLVLLFVDEPKLNTTRLHRVLRNLCYHAPTRTWVIRALLAMLQKTGECSTSDSTARTLHLSEQMAVESSDKGKNCEKSKCKQKSSGQSTSGNQSEPEILEVEMNVPKIENRTLTPPTWLSISLDAALGCRANVFHISRNTPSPTTNSASGAISKRHGSFTSSPTSVTIHPQASPLVCRHVLDTLISLAKSFPSQFLPQSKAKEAGCSGSSESSKDSDNKPVSDSQEPPDLTKTPSSAPVSSSQSSSQQSSTAASQDMDFWDILVRLDSLSGVGRKGKTFQRAHGSHPPSQATADSSATTFEDSPLGQLMMMLAHPVLRRSQLLTDRLLRLLGLVSISLPDLSQQKSAAQTPVSSVSSTAPTTVTTTATTAASSSTTTTTSMTSTATVTTPSPAPSNTVQATSAAEVVSDSRPTAATADTDSDSAGEAEETVLQNQLQLAVEVLTSKSCSEEGLEDATNLLLQLSRANNATRDTILTLLLGGARQLGLVVCTHIRSLLAELKELNAAAESQKEKEEELEEVTPAASQVKGMMVDRFQGGTVVVHATAKVKAGAGRELQLPSMTLLTSKTSSQQFLLRILKVIIQLREAARNSSRKDKVGRDFSNLSEAMEILTAGAEAIIEMVGQRSGIRDLESRPSASQAARSVLRQGLLSTAAPAATPGAPTAASGAPAAASGAPAGTPAAPSAGSSTTGGPSASGNQAADTDRAETPMDIDQPGPSTSTTSDKDTKDDKKVVELSLPRVSEQLQLDELWDTLGECLTELAKTPDHHAVLVLQPAVEAFFLIHAGEKCDKKRTDVQQQKREDQTAHLHVDLSAPMSPAPSDSQVLARQDSAMSTSSASIASHLPSDTQKFLKFADTHRTVLNHILRQTTTPLADGPFSVLVDHTRVLDFDVKRRYFRQELERADEGLRREDLAVHVRREHVFEDSFRELHRRTAEEWKHRFYIVFEGEEGQDAGGLLREWYIIISREIFNPMYALFKTSPGDRVTYTINQSSHCNSNHLDYFKFVGRIIAKAIYDNKLLECYFTRSFYKHILGVLVKYVDMESEDYAFYQGLAFLVEHTVSELGYDLTFSTEIQEFGKNEIRDLKPNGRNLVVTEENKMEYVKLVCQMKMTGAIRTQLGAFLEGFYDIIPKRLIAIFNEQELELLISGLPTIDIDDLKSNSEYHKYQPTSLQIQWFWRALRSFDQSDKARFLQFVTGTSKVPLQGFGFLEGMNGTQKFQIHRDDRSTDRLPAAHTCFNQLDLPAYETYDKLRSMLLIAIHECSEGFGLA